MNLLRCLPVLTLLLILPIAEADEAKREVAPAPSPVINLTGYRTLSEVIKADPKTFRADSDTPKPLGYLGVYLEDLNGKVAIDEIAEDSPAESAGLKRGDLLLSIGETTVSNSQLARDLLRGYSAGDELKLKYERSGESKTLTVVLKPLSKPLTAGAPNRGSTTAPDRAVFGIQIESAKEGVEITSVTSGGSAEKAGMKSGDILFKIDGKTIADLDGFRSYMGEKKPGDMVKVNIKRAKEELELRVTLGSDASARNARGPQATGWNDRRSRYFNKPEYKLAVIGVEYPDAKHNPKFSLMAWEQSLFSSGRYLEENVFGDRVYGSLNDYYQEISYGKLKVTGAFIDWVEVSKKKMDYNLGSSTSANDKRKYFEEVMNAVYKKHGNNILDGYDGIFFVFAGERVQTSRGGLYWPHKSNFSHQGKSWSYFIVPERQSTSRMTNISVICHEFGHMLGLQDLYARPENPGSEGVGVWCAMSQQLSNGRPQHFSAWSKEQLGWIKPVVIDPRVKQKIVLAPVVAGESECIKIPLRPDMTEYLLLENRQKVGFDQGLPSEGLLIWRVLPTGRGGQPVYLEESHGVEGPRGPSSFPTSVPFPSQANNAFTPFTTPSSKSQLGGGFDVFISNIRKLPDGRISFHVGYEYQ